MLRLAPSRARSAFTRDGIVRAIGVLLSQGCELERSCPCLTPSYNYWRTPTAALSSAPLPEAQGSPSWQDPSDAISSLPLGEALKQTAEIGGRSIELECGRFARLSDGSCLVRVGGTQVLATAVAAGQHNFVHRSQHFALPLQVEFRERMSAVGKFPPGYQRREGGSDHENLVAASVERAIASQFPPGFFRSVQVSTTLLSADGEVDSDVLAINAASAAMMCSNIPWGGPVAAVRVAKVGGQLVVNPPQQVASKANLSLLYVSREGEAVMLNLQGKEVPEASVIEAIRLAHTEASRLLQPQMELARATGRTKSKFALAGADPAAAQRVFQKGTDAVVAILQDTWQPVSQRLLRLAEAKAKLKEQLKASGFFRFDAMRVPGSGCVSPMDLDHAWSSLVARCVRDMILSQNVRPDGRGFIDVRETHSEARVLPVPHGSAVSSFGESQVLSAVTLANLRPQRDLPATQEPGHSQFFVHFTSSAAANNTVGQRFQRSPSRTEQQTGMFLEQALEPLIPSEAKFPFAIRVNADVLAANGSLAETAINSAALAIQSANVALQSQVAGISVGLISDAIVPQLAGSTPEYDVHEAQSFVPPVQRWELLTDTQAVEEEFGDMQLSTAGTRAGLLALQLDCSIPGVPLKVLEAAIARALPARLQLLDSLTSSVKQDPRKGPQFGMLDVAKEHIGRLVGPNGSVLRGIEESTGARVTILDDGTVHFFAPSSDQFQAAERAIGSITGNTLKEGQKYTVKVKKLQDYGAFVELPDGYQTLLHISELSQTRVRSVEEVLEVGQELEVLCLGKDNRGFMKVSRKALQQLNSPGAATALPSPPSTPPRRQ